MGRNPLHSRERAKDRSQVVVRKMAAALKYTQLDFRNLSVTSKVMRGPTVAMRIRDRHRFLFEEQHQVD